MALSPDCGVLATAGQDSTVFLFRVASTTVYEPMGFVRLSQPAGCMAWSPDSTKLLVGCRCVTAPFCAAIIPCKGNVQGINQKGASVLYPLWFSLSLAKLCKGAWSVQPSTLEVGTAVDHSFAMPLLAHMWLAEQGHVACQ